LPSEYFREHIYVTFQGDGVAFQMTGMCNARRLIWASDFPRSDSTWPWSQDVLKEHTVQLSQEEKDWPLHDNMSERYGLPLQNEPDGRSMCTTASKSFDRRSAYDLDLRSIVTTPVWSAQGSSGSTIVYS
jgi:hypothetical protein